MWDGSFRDYDSAAEDEITKPIASDNKSMYNALSSFDTWVNTD